MKLAYITDFVLGEYYGGAEMVDDTISKALGIPITKARDLTNIDPATHYFISNFTTLHPYAKIEFINKKNYSIFEHDYKIHTTRQPNRYPDEIFPKNELINVDFFESARTVYVQSTDHFDCYKKNGINANFVNLRTSIWSDKELDLLDSIGRVSPYTTHKFAIIDSTVPEKGTQPAINWCNTNIIDYELIPRLPKEKFYEELACHPALVYIPYVKESFCRLVVEARCMYMNVITPRTYGAAKEPWFNRHGSDLIGFLKESSKNNISIIASRI